MAFETSTQSERQKKTGGTSIKATGRNRQRIWMWLWIQPPGAQRSRRSCGAAVRLRSPYSIGWLGH